MMGIGGGAGSGFALLQCMVPVILGNIQKSMIK